MKSTLRQVVTALLIGTVIGTAFLLTACNRENITGTGEIKQETRTIAEFSGINVNGSYNLTGAQGDPQSFSLASNENLLPYIVTSVDDNVLNIESKKHVELHPAGQQTVDFKVSKFNSFTANGSSNFKFLNLTADNLSMVLSGSHHVEVSGQAPLLDIVVNGSADIDARNFKVDVAKIEINGSGTVYVNAAKTLDVAINGDGKIIYFGGTPQIKQTMTGSGEIKAGN